MEPAWLIRPLTMYQVVVALSNDAVVQAHLDTPLPHDNFRALLTIKPSAPLPIAIALGPYSVEKRAFTCCQASIPDHRHTMPCRSSLRTKHLRAKVPPP